jgi:ArsR family transcriptional regulator
MSFAAAALDVRRVSVLLKALADETRLRIVALLAHGELCVCHVEDALGLSQPNASRQLAVLRNGGVVESRRDGTWVYYRLARQDDAQRRRLLRSLIGSFPDQALLKRDVERLLRRRGPDVCR